MGGENFGEVKPERSFKKNSRSGICLCRVKSFLDTNPEHEEALCDYNKFTEELMNLKNMYEARYGPLTNFGGSPSRFPWQWIEEPWPWEED
ncbi:spore coat protein CotJB [Dehalobacterium formicoaceticum]|uniref:spore coat protein CotJB n=1 Tax=Dehalobacterium formicoaceticum TaxID=51515 RepID=UPI0030842399